MQFKILIDTFNSGNMTSLINEPTRIFTYGDVTARTAIDYVGTNIPDLIECNNFDPGISDHYVQLLKCKISCNSLYNINYNKSIENRRFNGSSLFVSKTFRPMVKRLDTNK